MRNARNPRRSRLIRKWDGTPVSQAAEGPVRAVTADPTSNADARSVETESVAHPADRDELIIDSECEYKISNNA